MRYALQTFVAVIGIFLGAVSCSGNNSGVNIPPQPQPTGNTQVYQQIERLARPAVKEATESFKNHDISNRANPYNDPTLQQSVVSFTDTFRKPSAGGDYGQVLASILLPDEIAADLSQPATTSAYLGVESGGATGNKFGGRGPLDDVIDTDLGAIFGKTLSALGLVKDDGQALPCLTTDNVGQSVTGANSQYPTISSIVAAKGEVLNQFPYFGAPK